MSPRQTCVRTNVTSYIRSTYITSFYQLGISPCGRRNEFRRAQKNRVTRFSVLGYVAMSPDAVIAKLIFIWVRNEALFQIYKRLRK